MSTEPLNVKTASIFLNGSYPADQSVFYRRAIESAHVKGIVIAVDGGLLLFERLGLKPDIILGDFDSLSSDVLKKYDQLQIIRFPENKGATDGELALRTVIDLGCTQVEFFGAVDTSFETDHMLANVLLLKLARRLLPKGSPVGAAAAIDHRQQINLVENESFEVVGRPDDYVSVIVLSEKATISITGMRWELNSEEVVMGSSLTVHNQLTAATGVITISGVGLVVHRHS